MECAICFGEITETTGRTQLSCKHEFHLKCVVTWLQREEGAGTCPCCRAEPGEMEQIGTSDSDSDDGSDAASEDSVEGVTELMRAAADNNVAEIRRLMDAGANPEMRDSTGDTALVWAVRNYADGATGLLIELGADVCSLALLCPDNEDEALTPELGLHGACHYGNVACMRYFLDSGVNVHCMAAGDGVSPLTTVIRSGEDHDTMEESVKLLMERGADPYRVDPTGWNSLMWFAEHEIGAPYIMRLMVPPTPSEAMKTAAARLIQTTWRHRQAVRDEKNCARILACLKFTVVNDTATVATGPVADSWFMDRMLRVT